LNQNAKKLEHDRPQHDSPAARVIAQQYSSATFVSSCSHSRKEKFVALLKKCYFNFLSFFFNCECLKLRNLKLRRSDIVCTTSQCYVCLLCQHRIINIQDKFCFVTTLRCKCHIICSVHCDYIQPHTQIQARGLYQIINHPYTNTSAYNVNKSPSSARYNARHINKNIKFTKTIIKIKFIFNIVYVNLVCWSHIFPCTKSPSVWRCITVTYRRVYMYG